MDRLQLQFRPRPVSQFQLGTIYSSNLELYGYICSYQYCLPLKLLVLYWHRCYNVFPVLLFIVACSCQPLRRFDIYIQRNNFQNIHEITIKTSHLIIYFHTLLYSRKSESIINLHSLECVFGKLVLNNYLKAILGFKAAKALPILCININATIFCFSDTYSQCSGLYA